MKSHKTEHMLAVSELKKKKKRKKKLLDLLKKAVISGSTQLY